MDTTIELKVIPSNAPSEFLTGSRFILDTPTDFGLELDKNVQELTDLNKIKTDRSWGFALPATAKNRFALDKYTDPNVDENGVLPVLITHGGDQLPYTNLAVQEFRDSAFGGEYECSVRYYEDHWLDRAEALRIKDIDLPDFDFTYENVYDNQRNDDKYIDGNTGVYFPLVYYGDWIYDNDEGRRTLAVEDYRYWIHLLYLLQEGFCHIGWDFESTFFETDFGRRLICYLHGESYGESGAEGKQVHARIEEGGEKNFYLPSEFGEEFTISFDDEVTDDFDVFDPATGILANYFGTCDIEVRLKGTTYGLMPTVRNILYFAIVKDDDSGSGTEIINGTSAEPVEFEMETGEFKAIDLTLKAKNVILRPQDEVYVYLASALGNLILTDESYITVKFKKKNYQNGDTISLGDDFDPDITFLDVIKGAAHLIDGKVLTDEVNRVVKLFPPYDTNVFGDSAEGFYQEDDTLELTDKIQKHSRRARSAQVDADRFHVIRFDNPDDPEIEDHPFQKEIDLGSDFKGEEKVHSNPLFAPTENERYEIGSNMPADMPRLKTKESEEPMLSYNIKPRICIALFGELLREKLSDGTFDTPWVKLRVGAGDPTPYLPYAFQKSDLYYDDPVDGEIPMHFKLIYGDEENDLWSLARGKSFYQDFIEKEEEPIIDLTPEQFHSFNFRRAIGFQYDDKYILCYPKEIIGYATNERIATPVVLRPKASLTEFCPGETPLVCDGNNPVIDQTYTEGTNCYDFEIGGSYDSAVDSYVIKRRYEDEDSWTTGTQVCNPDRGFFVRLGVYFSDDCPNVFRQIYVDPCGNSPQIIFSYNKNDGLLTIGIGGINNSTIDDPNTTITYTVDGGTEQTYTEPIEVTGTICAWAEVAYEGDCATRDTDTNCFEIPPPVVNCDDNNPEIVASVHDGDIYIEEELGGTYVSEVGHVEWYWKPTDSQEWQYHEGDPIRGFSTVDVKAIIIWCGECGVQCIEAEVPVV